MAAQDFAKTEVPVEKLDSPSSHQKMTLLLVALLIVVLGTFMGGFLLGKKQGIEIAAGEDKNRLEKLLRTQQDEMDKMREEAKQHKLPEVSTTQVGELTFYNELPRQKVQPATLHAEDLQKNIAVKPKLQVPTAPRPNDEIRKMIEDEMKQDTDVNHAQVLEIPVNSDSETSYILQVGSFQKQSDAYVFLEKMRKNGEKAFIRRVALAARGIWYRVYMGPYSSKKSANQRKDHVKESMKITGLVVKGH